MALVYLDTSALAKWYLNEAHSHEFSSWIQKQEDTHISSLTITEFRCLLARRRRNREFSTDVEQWVFAAFEMDIHDGLSIILLTITTHPVPYISLILYQPLLYAH